MVKRFGVWGLGLRDWGLGLLQASGDLGGYEVSALEFMHASIADCPEATT